MSFTNQTVTDIDDLITKLFAFLTGTPGWTQDQLDTTNNKAAIHKGNVYVSFRWATTSPTAIGIYQALGYTGGNDPGNHPNDSGNGNVSGTNATILTARRALTTNAPLQFWAFTDTTTETYCHVVVQTVSTEYVHFGFGNIEKVGDWTGGEYCYGQLMDLTQTSTPQTFAAQSVLLDGLLANAGAISNAQDYAGTIHIEGLPAENGASKWGVVMGPQGTLGNDRAGNSRPLVFGGFRAGAIANAFGRFSAASTKGLQPGYPIGLLYRLPSPTTDFIWLGWMKDVRGVSLEFYAPQDQVTIGSDTWILFPSQKKSSGSSSTTTGWQGIMYKKIT